MLSDKDTVRYSRLIILDTYFISVNKYVRNKKTSLPNIAAILSCLIEFSSSEQADEKLEEVCV